MLNILVSYARADGSEAASKLRNELARYNITVWCDVEDMRAAADWREQLNEALRETDAVLVLLTPGAVRSPEVTREWQIAKALEKEVIPVLISACDIPDELKSPHHRDLSQPGNYAGELVSLLRDLDVTIWQKVQDELKTLHDDSEYEVFQPLLSKLQLQLNARMYAPEIFKAFIYLIRQLHSDAKGGLNTLRQLLDKAIEGHYVLPMWPIHKVFQGSNHIFKSLLKEFREKTPSDPATLINVVLVVMNRPEAEELAAFEPLQEFLQASENKDWTERYGDKPEDWQPFGKSEGAATVEQVVSQALDEIGGGGESYVPVFEDIRTLNNIESRPLLKRLRHRGCVVVIDSISIYHPELQRAFQQSALETYPKTSVVTISPANNFAQLMREMTIVFQFRIMDMEFLKRPYDEDEELGVCEEILDERKFRKWLRDRVVRMYKPKPATIEEKDVREFMWKLFGGNG